MTLSRHQIPEGKLYDLAKQEKPEGWDYKFNRSNYSHLGPLIQCIEEHVRGPVILDVGCGPFPISVEVARQVSEKFAGVKIVGIDMPPDDDDMSGLQKIQDEALGSGAFLGVGRDIRKLNARTLDVIREDCRRSLTDFLGMDPREARADTLVLGGVVGRFSWKDPMDFLLDRVNGNGNIIITGLPEDEFSFDGRRMGDLARCLQEEGYDIVTHKFCGHVMSPDRVKALMHHASKDFVDAAFNNNPDYREHGLPALDYGRDVRRRTGALADSFVGSGIRVGIFDPKDVRIGEAKEFEYSALHCRKWKVTIHPSHSNIADVRTGSKTESMINTQEVFVLKKTSKVKPSSRGVFKEILSLFSR